jgi:DNA-binding LacI/PurR family transcriptional regulator
MNDVAQAAGVSQAAVSYAFNRPAKISAPQRERILEIAKQLGYHGPDAAGRSLRSGRVGAVGVLVMDTLAYAFSDPSNVELLRGVAEVGELADVAVTLLPSPPPPPGEDETSAAIREANAGLRGLVDGVIVHALPEKHRAVAAVVSRSIPIVVVDSPKLRGVSFVGLDDEAAAHSAARHVLGLGHTRIGILVDRLRPDGYAGQVDSARLRRALDKVPRDRVRGYLRAAEEHGIAAEDVPVIEAGGFRADLYLDAARTLLEQHDVTAVLAMSDVLAIAVLDVARDLGRAVPQELSVIGFDDAPDAESHGLTTIRQPLAEKGRVAAQLLLDLIETGKRRSVILPTELVVRSTTARAKAKRRR